MIIIQNIAYSKSFNLVRKILLHCRKYLGEFNEKIYILVLLKYYSLTWLIVNSLKNYKKWEIELNYVILYFT